MDVKLAFFLELFFIVMASSDVRHSDVRQADYPKTCQGPAEAPGGTPNQMVGTHFPCNADEDNQQSGDTDEEAVAEPPRQPPDVRFNLNRSEQIAQSVLDLSQRLTASILEESTKKFEIVSPISIASALQLALLGSGGMTFTELMDLMDYTTKEFSQNPYKIHEEFGLLLEDLSTNTANPSRYRPKVPWRAKASKEYIKRSMKFQSKQPNENEHKISVANGIFIQRDFTIRDEYREVVQKEYGSEIQELDFRGSPQQSAKTINDWVNDKTNGKIKEIIPGSANPETRVILANALYFNAEWQETFIEGATGPKKFFPNGKDSNDSIMVDLMAHGGKFPHHYDPESDCEILGLPYKQNATTMYVILPKNSNPERLRAAQKLLTADKIERMISQMVIKTAVILLPKMHLACGHHLKSKLQDLGLRTLFEPHASDLSVMASGRYNDKGGSSANQWPSNPQPQNSFPAASRPSSNAPESFSNRFPTAMNNHDEDKLIFSRAYTAEELKKRPRRDVTYKVGSENSKNENPLTVKDFMLRKRIVKKSQMKKLRRSKRQFTPMAAQKLDVLRHKNSENPRLYAEEVIHKVDLTINEKGTEGGAATAITLNRSGTSVVFRVDVPFMFLIRHDPTRVPLFYGVVFEPKN